MNMDKKYIAPQIDVVLLKAIDVVTASDGYDNYEDDAFNPLSL